MTKTDIQTPPNTFDDRVLASGDLGNHVDLSPPVRLNIGAGKVAIEGFTPIDRSVGLEAYPLTYADNSVDEIRASHILEHFPQALTQSVLRDWVRVLKPGGRIRIAVPDFNKIAGELRGDLKRFTYLMGGQTDENDYHKSVWTTEKLLEQMEVAGLSPITSWVSDNTDCASLPVSLNLQGVKSSAVRTDTVKIRAIMSVPRYGSLAARGIMDKALSTFKIPLTTSQGVFWGQCMQRDFVRTVDDGIDWILTIDYDSVFSAEQLDQLFGTFGPNPHIDALSALQVRRDGDKPLLTCGNSGEIQTDMSPILVTTSHFGLTLIRVEVLKTVPRPWFKSEPDKDGNWSDDRLDDDIWFWHQWRLAGKKIFVDPKVRIGHVEECVSWFDEHLKVQRSSVPEWREANVK